MDLYEAWDALDNVAWVGGGSDQALVDRVQDEADYVGAACQPPVQVKQVMPAVGLTGPVALRPIEALLQLAKATAPRVRDDVYDMYRHWGWLRYLGSLARSASGTLELSAAGRDVRGNQRRVLSEELGVGFGVQLACEVWCRTLGAKGSIMLVDVDVALSDGFGWSSRLQVGGRKPDYLLLVDDAADPTVKTVKALECKGTVQVGYAWTQLAKAMTQLASLTFDGVVPQGVAISTVSGPEGFSYLALDPEEDAGRTFSVTTEKVQTARRRKDLWRRDGAIDIPGDEMIATAVAVGLGSLADYAGNVEGARKWLPPTAMERLSRADKRRTRIPMDEGDFVGVESVFPTPDGGRLRVFQGLEASIDQVMVDGRVEELSERQALFGERYQQGELRATEKLVGHHPGSVINAVSSDGAVLRLEIE